MDYYKETQFLAVVDKHDKMIGRMEKWEAHKKGVLHRGYTAILEFNNTIILQHRKHPAFDNVFDLSFSSHQLMVNGNLQTDEETIYEGMKREWNIDKVEILSLKFLNKVYYQAKDPISEYSEHEIDYIYLVQLNRQPKANPDYAYGQKTVDRNNAVSEMQKSGLALAPWVKKIVDLSYFRIRRE